MATINNVNSLMFAPEANNVTVSATNDVAVQITITTADGQLRYDQTSTYTPVNGTIEFGDLADLINKCILLHDNMSTLDPEAGLSPWAQLGITVTDGDTEATASGKVFYCTAGNASSPTTFKVFGTQLRKRWITTDIEHYMLWLPLMDGVTYTVTTNVTYVNNGTQATKAASTNYTMQAGYPRWQPIDCAVPELVASVLGSTLYATATVYEYTVVIYISGTVYDSVTFTVDRRNFPEQSLWYFRNIFGLTDQILLRGRQEESHNMEATFGYSGWNMVRLDDDVAREFTTNTGWLTKAECRLMAELYRSPLVGKQEELGLRRVVIRDIDVSHRSPTNEPRSLDITWRYADKRVEWYGDIDGDTAGHNIFDDTFSIAFD